MKERLPSVFLVSTGLFGYQLDRGMPPASVSQTRLVPAIMNVQPEALVQPLPG